MPALPQGDKIGQSHRGDADLENSLTETSQAHLGSDEYRYSFELSPQVSWTADADGSIIDFNQLWLDLTGLTRGEALGDGWNRVVHTEDLPAMAAAWKRSIGNGEPFDVEHRVLTRRGEYRWMRSRAVARRNATGGVARWYGSTEDIQERKEAELLLRNSERMFSAAFDEAPIGMVLLSCDGAILKINQAYREMLGYDSDDLTGKDTAGITHPDDVPLTQRFFTELQNGKFYKTSIEKRYFHRDGRIIWAKASGTMRRDAQGRPMQVVAIVEDITLQKRAETVLRESEERLRLIFAQAPVAVCVLRGRDLVYELVNPKYEIMVPHRRLVGLPLAEALPEISPELIAILRRVLETGEPFSATEFLIPLDRNRDGIAEDCWFNFVYHPERRRFRSATGRDDISGSRNRSCLPRTVSSHLPDGFAESGQGLD
jgi:PAS domain S-box-containing protein